MPSLTVSPSQPGAGSIRTRMAGRGVAHHPRPRLAGLPAVHPVMPWGEPVASCPALSRQRVCYTFRLSTDRACRAVVRPSASRRPIGYGLLRPQVHRLDSHRVFRPMRPSGSPPWRHGKQDVPTSRTHHASSSPRSGRACSCATPCINIYPSMLSILIVMFHQGWQSLRCNRDERQGKSQPCAKGGEAQRLLSHIGEPGGAEEVWQQMIGRRCWHGPVQGNMAGRWIKVYDEQTSAGLQHARD